MRRAVVIAGFVLAVTGCGAPDPIPDELYGTWSNPDPAYRGRSFEVREGWVVFHSGAREAQALPIESLDIDPGGTTTTYTLEYRAEDGALVPLRLRHTPGPPETLRIGSREDAWVPDALEAESS